MCNFQITHTFSSVDSLYFFCLFAYLLLVKTSFYFIIIYIYHTANCFCFSVSLFHIFQNLFKKFIFATIIITLTHTHMFDVDTLSVHIQRWLAFFVLLFFFERFLMLWIIIIIIILHLVNYLHSSHRINGTMNFIFSPKNK